MATYRAKSILVIVQTVLYPPWLMLEQTLEVETALGEDHMRAEHLSCRDSTEYSVLCRLLSTPFSLKSRNATSSVYIAKKQHYLKCVWLKESPASWRGGCS